MTLDERDSGQPSGEESNDCEMNENTDEPFESQTCKPAEQGELEKDDDSKNERSEASEYESEDDEDEGDESSEDESMEEGPNPVASPADGGLSTYEKMRLERIRRNKEYLATLGLEKLGEKQEVKPQRKPTDKWDNLEKRETIQRRSKMKEVVYTSPKPSKKSRSSLGPEDEAHDRNDRLTRRPKSSSKVSLVIYKELKATGARRRRDFKTARTLLRLVEVELKYAKRQAASYTQKQQRIVWEEQMKVAAQAFHNERKQLLPMIQEIDSRRGELLVARDKFRRHVKAAADSSQTRRTRAFQNMKNVQLRFGAIVKEAKLHLAHHFFDRVCSMESVKAEEAIIILGKSSKAKGTGHKMDSTQSVALSKDIVQEHGINVNEILDKVKNDKKGVISKNVKNVWGPVTGTFGNTLQRQWLENDAPVAANLISQYVPQVGDAVLYYPSAHRDFLLLHPDPRAKKRKSRLPLWEKAQEELDKEADADSRPWCTREWIASILDGTGRYPIFCYVEQTSAEFPRDPNMKEESKRKSNVVGSGIGPSTDSDEMKTRNSSSRPRAVKKEGPSMVLQVTLKPIAKVLPPTLNSNGKYVESTLYVPPSFCVQIIPTDSSPFLVPFSWAFRSAMSLHTGEKVEWTSSSGFRAAGSVVNSVDDLRISKLDLFSKLNDTLMHDANCDLYSVEKLHEIIYDAFVEKKDVANIIPLKEVDLRHAIQVVSFQYVKTNTLDCTILSDVRTSFSVTEASCREVVLKIWKWILHCLPQWKGARVQPEGINIDETETVSAWDIKLCDQKKGNVEASFNDTLVKALAPALTLLPVSSIIGGHTYQLEKELALRVDAAIKAYIDIDPNVVPFIEPIDDKLALSYSYYVPIGMSLRRIQRRLKMQMVRMAKPFRLMCEDIVLQEDDDLKCPYYRSVDSLLCDVEDIYANCLLYNAPDSEIVGTAWKFANSLSAVITAVSAQYLSDFKLRESNERLVKRTVQLPGKLDQDLHSLAFHGPLRPEHFDSSSRENLSCGWLESSLPDGSSEDRGGSVPNASSSDIGGSGHQNIYDRGLWLPQCGDKILYNAQMHRQFVSGHSLSLTEEQLILPTVAPNKSPPTSEHDLTPTSQYWMYGTITRVQPVSPKAGCHDSNVTFDVNSPILAIGVKFHYFWLSNVEQVIYWRPCRLTDQCNGQSKYRNGGSAEEANGAELGTEGNNSLCPFCHLSYSSSFLVPAWSRKSLRIIPPFPTSSLNLVNPTGVDERTKTSILSSFQKLKNRCTKGLRFDAIDEPSELRLFEKLMEINKLPVHLQSIFDDLDEHTVSDTISPGENDARLRSVNYLPCDSSRTASEGEEIYHSDEHAQSKGHKNSACICIELVHNRVMNGFYRGTYAILHDIFQSLTSCILTLLKESSNARGLSPNSSKKIASHVLMSLIDDLQASVFDPVSSNGDRKKLSVQSEPFDRPSINSMKETEGVNVNAIDSSNEAQRSFQFTSSKVIISRLQSAFRLADKPLNNKESALMKQVDNILEFHAAALACVLDFYSAEAALGSSSTALDIQDKGDFSFPEPRMQALKVADDILASLAPERLQQRSPFVKVKVKLRDTLFLDPSFDEDGDTIMEHDEGTETETELCNTDTITEIDTKEKTIIDLKTPVATFSFSDYHNNERLVQALFCCKGLRSACARCKLGFKSVLWCRATSCHVNPDFVYSDYLHGIGGLNGLIDLLTSGKVPNPTSSIPVPSSNASNTLMDASTQQQSLSNQTAVQGQISESQKPDINRVEILQKAELAFELATKLMERTTSLLNGEVELSEEFIRDTFPMDPTDGHYEVCIKCGRGGDVLCCESCPTVSHYHCVGLPTVPEGDWRCWKCIRTAGGGVDSTTTASSGPLNSTAPINESLSNLSEMIDSLRSIRRTDNVPGRSERTKDADSSSDTDDSSSESEPEETEFEPQIGSELMKVVDGKKITGEIVALPKRRSNLFRVLFANGGLEYISEDDVRKFRSNYLEDQRRMIKAGKGAKKKGTSKVDDGSSTRERRPNVPKGPKNLDQISIDPLPPKPWPRPGFIEPTMTYYACLANDTYAKIAYKVGLKYWYQVAAVVDNQVRYGKDYHSFLPVGDLVRLPLDTNETMVKALVDPTITMDVQSKVKNKAPVKTVVDPNITMEVVESKGKKKVPSTLQSEVQLIPAVIVKNTSILNLPTVKFPPVPTPRPGFVDLRKNYYCCEDNETCVRIARKIGCDSWQTIASISENRDRYGGSALDDEKTRFRKGTLIRIPFDYDREKVASLVDRSSHKRKRA